MRARLVTAGILAATVAWPAGLATDDAAAAKRPAPKLRMAAFDDCSELVGYARRYAPRVGPSYAPGGPVAVDTIDGPAPAPPSGGGSEGSATTDAPQAAPPAAPTTTGDSSSTNVQEQGVDEPDVVKSDGKTIFTIANGRLHAVDARSAQPRLLATLDVQGQGEQLLVHGNRLLVIGTTYVDVPPQATAAGNATGAPSIAPAPYYYKPVTVLTEVDVSDPGAMKMIRSELVEGRYVSARLTGDTSRVVVTSPPASFAPDAPATLERRVSGWVPKSAVVDRRTGRTRRRSIVPCGSVRHPRTFAGLDMLTVLTIDMSRGLPAVDTDSLLTSADDVYASKDSLYIATRRWTAPPQSPDQPPPRGATAIHRFDTSAADKTVYKASGEVPGYVLNQWSMSEHKGVLRVASTQDPEWWDGAQRAQSESSVTTLAERDGALVKLGSVGGLGKGERIFGVRFIEDTGYVITFRQTDPLYTVDVSTPTDPKVLGELKILGYSAYLHPIGPDLLLGVGQDATEEGRRLGTQLSVFDVSDLRNPRRIHQLRLDPGSSSSAEFDHRAFLWWQPREVAFIPLRQYGSPDQPFLGAVGFKVSRATGIGEVGRISHDWADYPAEVERVVVVGERAFTVSGLGVKSNDLGTFADVGRADFPQPPRPQYGGPGTAIP